MSCLSTCDVEQLTADKPYNEWDLQKTNHSGFTIDGTN